MHLFGIPLLVFFLLAFLRRAEPVPVEEIEESEFASDDFVTFRVESEEWMPVRVERD